MSPGKLSRPPVHVVVTAPTAVLRIEAIESSVRLCPLMTIYSIHNLPKSMIEDHPLHSGPTDLHEWRNSYDPQI
jgi:hypothetical protein